MWLTFEEEGLIKDDTKVTDMCGSRNCGAIDAEGEIVTGFVALIWSRW